MFSHLSCQEAQPRDGSLEWITLRIPFAADHTLDIIVPDLLTQLGFLVGKLPYGGPIVGEYEHLQHEWRRRQLAQPRVLPQGCTQSRKWLAHLHKMGIHLLF